MKKGELIALGAGVLIIAVFFVGIKLSGNLSSPEEEKPASAVKRKPNPANYTYKKPPWKPDPNPPPAHRDPREKRIVGEHWFGAVDRRYFKKLIDYAVQQDAEAFNKALAQGLLAGQCTTFRDGETVFVTDSAIFSGSVRVRRKGETREYWTGIEAIK